jgi:hypothetical protein
MAMSSSSRSGNYSSSHNKKKALMVGKFQVLRAAAVGALAVPLVFPAMAQDGGVTLAFGLDQRFEVTDNLNLDLISPGTTSLATTALSFGLTSETALSTLDLTASAALRARSGPGISGVDTLIDDPRFGLRYMRDGATARFSLAARYRSSEVTFLRPLEDFLNDEGDIELPEDAADLEGSGTRVSYGLDSTLELRRDAPLGLSFSAGLSGLRYSGVSNPDLVDSRRSRLGASARLTFSPVAEGGLGVNYSTYAADDAASTRRETLATDFTLRYEISPITRADAGVGYVVIDTEEFGLASRTEGATGHLKLELDRPNGMITAGLDSTFTADGARYSASIGRSLDLPNGALSASAGLTAAEGGAPQTTASLSWRQNLPRGAFSAQLRRSVNIAADDTANLATVLALGYRHDINALSALDFRATYSVTGETGPDNRVDRASFTASYLHALTADWNLNAGYTYRMRDEETVGQARSNTIFVGLGRAFSLRP